MTRSDNGQSALRTSPVEPKSKEQITKMTAPFLMFRYMIFFRPAVISWLRSDEPTVDYLIAVLSMRFEQYDVSSRLVAGILVNPSANPRMKDKARMIKEMLVKKIKEKNAAKK